MSTPQVKNVSWLHAAKLRAHPDARPVGANWRMISDTNITDAALLVSMSRLVTVSFPYGVAYHTVMRARILAEQYARTHPEPDAVAGELIIEPIFPSSRASVCDGQVVT